jgi:hypothetical protein
MTSAFVPLRAMEKELLSTLSCGVEDDVLKGLKLELSTVSVLTNRLHLLWPNP